MTNQQLQKNTSRGIVYFKETEEALVHIGTISKFILFQTYHNCFTLAPIQLFGAGHYKLSGLKEMVVTESFLGMEKKLIKCQNIETVETCNTRSYLLRIQKSCSCIPFILKYHAGPVKAVKQNPNKTSTTAQEAFDWGQFIANLAFAASEGLLKAPQILF